MKKKCIICVQAKGKRTCIQYDKAMVCPKCCAQLRNPSCESCSYYKIAQKYEVDKFRKSGDKSFVIELNEEVDIPNMVKYMDQAIRMSDPETVIHQQAKNLLDDVENIIRDQNGTDLETYLKAQEQFQLGVEFMERCEWKKAIHAFGTSEGIVNTIPQVYGNLGICHAQLGQKYEALAAFDKALGLDPQYELAIADKAITQSLEEGEKLNTKIKTVEYYKDFPMKNKSYLQYLIEEGSQKPDTKIK